MRPLALLVGQDLEALVKKSAKPCDQPGSECGISKRLPVVHHHTSERKNSRHDLPLSSRSRTKRSLDRHRSYSSSRRGDPLLPYDLWSNDYLDAGKFDAFIEDTLLQSKRQQVYPVGNALDRFKRRVRISTVTLKRARHSCCLMVVVKQGVRHKGSVVHNSSTEGMHWARGCIAIG